MPVDLSIVESTTELGQTVVEVVLESASEPGPAGPGVPAGGTLNQVLTKDSGTDYDTSWQDAQGGGGGAPDDATYLVTTAHGDLSAEVVVGATPGGELGGTWVAPTVDATHSGSSHATVQANAEATAAAALLAHTSDGADRHPADNITNTPAGGIAATDVQAALNELDSEKAALSTFNDHSARHEDGGADEISLTGLSGTPAALTTHEADTTSVHGIADTSALALTANHPTNATFNDHSARHEDGGADEISIAGLAGTPVELTNHLNDAADAHDASAISVADAAGFYTGADVEAVLQELGVFASYTPSLTASTTNPTLGSGSSALGRWTRIGGLGIASVFITFGTSGVAAGTGTYRVSVPWTFHASAIAIGGVGMLYDSSAFDSFLVMTEPAAGLTYVTMFIGQSVTAGAVTHNAPFAWAASDQIRLNIIGEIA